MMVRDRSRQWARPGEPISAHHAARYIMAARMASGRTLDAACGCGYGTGALNAAVGDVVGVDFNAEAIQWAKTYYPGPEYICADIGEAPWSGEFETVVSLETVEHIKDPSEALKAFRRACIGKFIVSVPNEDLYPFKAEAFSNDESPHYRHYTPAEFEALLTEHGFSVEERFCQLSKQLPQIAIGTDGRFLIYVCR